MANLGLALRLMELLHLLTRVVTAEWPEGEAWKVMKQLQDIYWLNKMRSIGWEIIKMGADESPSRLFCYFVTLEQEYAHTKGRMTNDDMIGAIFANAPWKYRATLNLVSKNQVDALQPSNFEALMR